MLYEVITGVGIGVIQRNGILGELDAMDALDPFLHVNNESYARNNFV